MRALSFYLISTTFIILTVSGLALAESGWVIEGITSGSVGGALGAVFATVTFLPHVVKSVKAKKADDISLLMIIFAFIGNIGWLLLGFDKSSPALIFSASLIMILLMPLLWVKWLDIKREKRLAEAENEYFNNNMPC